MKFAAGCVLLLGLLALPARPDGKAAYDKTCKSCHGADGAGNPAIAKMMKITFKHLGSKEVQAKKDAELSTDVTKGVGKMKPVTSLSAAEVKDVVAHLRTLKQ